MTERALIDRLLRRARRHRDGQTVLGPGDDGALIQSLPGGLVISTDSYFEGSHYQSAWLDPEQLGERCLGAALSDLAAMGALPRFYTLSLTLSGRETDDFVERLGAGLGQTAQRYKVDLIGGDLTSASLQGLVITVLGTPLQGRVLSRGGARAGDELWVSGQLGASAAGLDVLKANPRDRSALSDGFRAVSPRILLGTTLARMGIASAGIDISDGLVLDLHRLCEASGCGAQLDRRLLPVDPRVRRVAELMNQPVEPYVCYGGEDYELLFSVPPAMTEALNDVSDATSVRLTRIGRITKEKQVVDQRGNPLPRRGWDPFSENS